MIKIIQALLFLFLINAQAQQAYYNDVNLTLTGQALFLELQQKIDINNNTFNYGDNRTTILFTDENPDKKSDVLLVYGYDNSNCTTQRSRDKDDFGGGNCEYNREHVFARSNANPEMGSTNNGSTGIIADPHNIRPSDQKMNNNRGSKKFGSGSGNAGNVGSGNWYPGDEWKGDVARMMMYMYTKYGERCLPSLNGTGPKQEDSEMLKIYLQWNIEDPVNPALEDKRNNYLENNYGNRNPFIDNPYLATLIWGGETAEDRWNLFDVEDKSISKLIVYPNPAQTYFKIKNLDKTSGFSIEIYVRFGRKILSKKMSGQTKKIVVSDFPTGIYFLKLESKNQVFLKKLIKN